MTELHPAAAIRATLARYGCMMLASGAMSQPKGG